MPVIFMGSFVIDGGRGAPHIRALSSHLQARTVIGLLQRVTRADVNVAGECIGAIEAGLLVLVGVEQSDSEREGGRLVERLLGYRVFADAAGKMNLSVRDTGGGLLLVPQFTLAADTNKGMRPSFSSAATPEEGQRLFEYVLRHARTQHHPVAAGKFGADMKVTLTNDGPVTFWLRVAPAMR
jgi:D-tyrosyl-tRNA(Tyr) deacylase